MPLFLLYLGDNLVHMVATIRESWLCRGCSLIDILVLRYCDFCAGALWVTKRMNLSLRLIKNTLNKKEKKRKKTHAPHPRRCSKTIDILRMLQEPAI